MSRCVYDKASITLINDTYHYICDTIQSITEYDHEIEFETVIPIDGVKRGWVGALYYHMRGAHIEDDNVKATSVTCLNDVLCTRSYNQRHAFQTQENRNVSGYDKWNAKLNKEDVRKIKEIKRDKKLSNEKIGQMFNVDASVISRIINNKSYIDENRVFNPNAVVKPILPDLDCHYYNHEKVSAYESLFFRSLVNPLDYTIIIRWHMQPYFWEKDNNEKLQNKYRKLWGEELYQDIMKVHKADKEAH